MKNLDLDSAARGRERAKRWAANNRERRNEYARERRKCNRDRVLGTQRKWVAANNESVRESKRNWYLANKETEEFKEKNRQNSLRWQKMNPEKKRLSQKKAVLKREYGLTPEEREAIFIKQKRRCRICRTKESDGHGFHIDHCHKSRKVRGILCHSCNLMIGQAKENLKTLKAAIAYLKNNEVNPAHPTKKAGQF